MSGSRLTRRLPDGVLFHLLACAVCLFGMLMRGLGVLLRFSCVLLTLRIVILAVLLGRLAMGLGGALVVLSSFVVFVLCHFG